MPELRDIDDNALSALNRRIMDACYPVRAERLISPATISDYVRQRLADNPAQVVKLLIELDDCRALLNCLAPQTNQERIDALDFHNQLDDPFDAERDE
jgi:hypothetical protein